MVLTTRNDRIRHNRATSRTQERPSTTASERPAARNKTVDPSTLGSDGVRRTRVIGDNASTSGGAQANARLAPSMSTGGGAAVQMRLQKGGAHPAVAALLKKYQPKLNADVGRPFERVLLVADNIDRFIMQEPRDAGKLADLMLAKDVRKHLFQMEAMLRLYKDKHGEAADKPLDKVKALEDGLGGWSLYVDLGKVAREKGFPSGVIAVVDRKAAEARGQVVEIVEDDWLPDAEKRDQVPALNKLIKNLSGEKWGSYEKDRNYLAGQVAEHLEEIKNTDFNLDDLQGGIHELRRQLRWIPLYMLSSGGAFQLSDTQNPVPALRTLLHDAEANSPFVKMPAADRERDPISVSKSLFIANSKLIGELGGIKDDGEYVEYLAEAWMETGVSSEEAHKQAARLLGASAETSDVHARAKKAFATFKEQGVLSAMRKELED